MRKASFKLLLGATAIGFAPIFAKLLTEHGGLGPVASGFWRMAIGSLGFMLLLILGDRHRKSSQDVYRLLRDAKVPVFLAGLLFAADLVAWHTSFLYTNVGVSSLIANLSAVFVPITGVLFFREKLRPSIVLGGALAFCGLLGLTSLKSNQASLAINESPTLSYVGECLALLTAFFYTGYIIAIKHVAKTFSSRAIMLVSSMISAVIIGLIAVGVDYPILPTSALGWLLVIGLGIVSQVIGQGLVASALSDLPVSQSAILLLWAPISSVVFGRVILGDIMNIGQLVSMAVTLIGIAIVVRL